LPDKEPKWPQTAGMALKEMNPKEITQRTYVKESK